MTTFKTTATLEEAALADLPTVAPLQTDRPPSITALPGDDAKNDMPTLERFSSESHKSQEQPKDFNSDAYHAASPPVTYVTRSALRSKLRDSRSSSETFVAWSKFVGFHRNQLDSHVKYEEVRRTFTEKRLEFREANSTFRELLQNFQSSTSDTNLQNRVLKQSWKVANIQEELDNTVEQLNQVEEELVKVMFTLQSSLPEILRKDKDPEEDLSVLRKQGFDFRGESSKVADSVAATLEDRPDADLDSSPQLILSKLGTIDDIESSILGSRNDRARVQEGIWGEQDPGLREDALKQLDEVDNREDDLLKELNKALAELEKLRCSASEIEEAENDDIVLVDGPSNMLSDETEARSQNVSVAYACRVAESPSAILSSTNFAPLTKIFRSQPVENVTVFPVSTQTKTSSERADPFDVINAWLFHQLRTSDQELERYFRRLAREKLPISAKQVGDYCLRTWFNDATYDLSRYPRSRNTTNRTDLGESHLLFSNTAPVSYQLGLIQTSRGRQPPAAYSPVQLPSRRSPVQQRVPQEDG